MRLGISFSCQLNKSFRLFFCFIEASKFVVQRDQLIDPVQDMHGHYRLPAICRHRPSVAQARRCESVSHPSEVRGNGRMSREPFGRGRPFGCRIIAEFEAMTAVTP